MLTAACLCSVQSAYQNYLRSTQFIMQYLAADIVTNESRGSLPAQTAVNLFKMAKQCLERAEEMYESARGEGRPLAHGEREGVDSAAVPIPSQAQVGVASQTGTAAVAAYQPQYQNTRYGVWACMHACMHVLYKPCYNEQL